MIFLCKQGPEISLLSSMLSFQAWNNEQLFSDAKVAHTNHKVEWFGFAYDFPAYSVFCFMELEVQHEFSFFQELIWAELAEIPLDPANIFPLTQRKCNSE